MFHVRSLRLPVPVSVLFAIALQLVASHAAAQCVPPSITSQPSSLTVCAGSPASFSVSAAGTALLSYQWRKDTSNIFGATSATYSIATTAAASAGSYDVVVTNACGSATSVAAVLTVDIAPSIASQPSNLTVCAASPASFSVSAAGTAPFRYQWRKDSNNLVGATSATYSIATATAAHAGSYDVVVTNACGSVTSAAATLTVEVAASITSQPSSLTVCAGSPASFSVSAAGTAPLSYQWRKNSANIGGATSAMYSIAAATAVDAGSYDVVVTNACGLATSAAATLTVAIAPSIKSQPDILTVCAGSPVSFSVSVVGTAPLSYQWRKNSVNIVGATSDTYSIAAVTVADAGSYDAIVTNVCGSATGGGATLIVQVAASITSQPSSLTVCAGSPASFSVSAAGTAPFSYQWRKNSANIGGATSATYSVATATAADAGSYDVIVTNVCGSITSAGATLTVQIAASITSQPSRLTVCAGSPASFSVSAVGTAPLTYQWRKDGVNLGGATSATYSIATAMSADAGGYDVVVTNVCGSVTSAAATLTVDIAPSITSQPRSLAVCVGSPASFSVSAAGTAPLGYQWRKDGANIGGATSATYSITAATAVDAGSYDVVVTNVCGPATSAAASFTVDIGLPVITTQPMSQAVCVGATVTLSVVASGASNTYQWQKDLVPIPGATSASYTIASAQLADSGTYAVTVANPCGTRTSVGAAVAVNANARITSTCVRAGSLPRRALAVDLDGIRGQDMVVAAYASGTLEVSLNDGASGVTPQTPVPVGAGLSGLAAQDFDGDGNVDVAVTNRITGTVSVLYGNGAGGFAVTFVFTVGGDPIAVAATPILGHARADLVIADAGGRLLVASNDANTTPGARTFSPLGAVLSGGSYTDVAAADVVGSTVAEIVATEASSSVVHVLDATSLVAIAGSPWPCATAPAALAMLDVTGDGKADPIVGGASGVTVLQTPTMAQNAVWATPVVSVTAGNFDADVKADLALVAASGQVVLLHGYNNGAPPDSIEAGSCLLSGTHVATGRISAIGFVGGAAFNTDELLLVRSSIDLACVLRFRMEHLVRPITGSGCPGFSDAGSAIGLPTIGNAGFLLTLAGARASALTFVAIQANTPSGSSPVLFPIGPCRLILDVQQPYFLLSALTSPAGQAFLPFPMPTATASVALELRWQWLTVDSTSPVLGLTFSRGSLLRVGEY